MATVEMKFQVITFPIFLLHLVTGIEFGDGSGGIYADPIPEVGFIRLQEQMKSSEQSELFDLVIHSCEFNLTLCEWTTSALGTGDEVRYHLPTKPTKEEYGRLDSSRERENYWRDYVYINVSHLFLLTSPEFQFKTIEPAPGHEGHAHSNLINAICVSFSARASHWTRAGLFHIDPTDFIGNSTRLIWNIDASPDDSWTDYHLTIRPSEEFKLQFVISRSLLENHGEHYDEHVYHKRPNVFFAIGYILLKRGHCMHDMITESNKMMKHKKTSQIGDEFFNYVDSRLTYASPTVWPNGIVPYVLADGHFSSEQKSMIRTAMLDINNRTCIQFVPRYNAEWYLEITGDQEGCFASVGFTGGYSFLNLSPASCFDMRTIRHELLHVLGFLHEHQRPDRDQYVDILWENIDETLFQQFDLENEASVDYHGLPYDYESVMHYGDRTFSKNGGKTMRAKFPWARIGQIQTFSSLDIVRMNSIYECDNFDANAAYLGECTIDMGNFICERYAPCEYGELICPSPYAYDSTSKTCKIGKVIGDACDAEKDVCSVENSECSGGVCTCLSGYYVGEKNDCLVDSQNKHLGDACDNIFQCTYNLFCISLTCQCQDYQVEVGNYDCENKKFGDPCTTNQECTDAIPAAWCIDGTCQCPSAFYATTYVDETGTTQQACQQNAYLKAGIGDSCAIYNGQLCEESLICRTCPNSLADVCTLGREFAVAWNSFPDKPIDYYVISASDNRQSKHVLSLFSFISYFVVVSIAIK